MQFDVSLFRGTRCVTATVLACAVAAPAHAQDENSWDFTGFLYLWGASIGGESTTGQSIDVSFSDLVENLDFGIMGSLEARRNKWALFGDAIYLAVSDPRNATVGPGIPATADIEVEGFVFTGGVGYDLFRTDRSHLNGFGGIRYINMSTDVNIAIPVGSRRLSDTLSNLDGVIGLRGFVDLSDRWQFGYYADIGTGDSERTWQAAAKFDYDINDRWTASFGYRHMSWDVDNSVTLSDISFSGPFAGAKYSF